MHLFYFKKRRWVVILMYSFPKSSKNRNNYVFILYRIWSLHFTKKKKTIQKCLLLKTKQRFILSTDHILEFAISWFYDKMCPWICAPRYHTKSALCDCHWFEKLPKVEGRGRRQLMNVFKNQEPTRLASKRRYSWNLL